MKYSPSTDNSLLYGKTQFIYRTEETDDRIDSFLKSSIHSCKCPLCGTESSDLHATYERTLQDVPIRCKPTYVHVNIFKYNCVNTGCRQKVFMEPLSFASASQVRTNSLNALVLAMAMFMSNEGASTVLSLMGVAISNDTIQRLYDRIEFKDNPDVEAVGIDDVATRKGQKYATAIYDLKDHHMITLLEGWDGAPLKEWLKGHKKIRLVARDRAGAYASAISEVLPECTQVADRFHLMQNLLDKMKDIFKNEIPSTIFIKDGTVLNKAPEKEVREKGVTRSGWMAFPMIIRRRLMKMELKLHSRARSGTSTASSIRRMPITGKKQQLIRDIQLFWDGLPKKKISLVCRKYGIARHTAKKYISMTDEEINGMDAPKNYKTRKRAGNDFINIIYKMMEDGYDDEIIYQYLRKSGVSTSRSNLCDYIQAISKENFPDRKRMYGMRLMDQRYPDDVIVIRRNELLKHILTIDPKKKRIRSFLKIWISFRRSSQRSHGL